MRIAIPVVDGQLSAHFGHASSFAIFDVDETDKEILKSEELPAPDHMPGLLPRWLHEQGVNLVITGGMGSRALDLFNQASVQVIIGVEAGTPEAIVRDYLEGKLAAGSNVCDH